VGSSTVSRIRVLVAETDSYGRAVSAAIEKDRRLELVDCVGHAAEAVARAVELAPDILVLDEDISGGAIAAAVEIGARMPAVPLVITHDSAAADGLLEALAAGVCAYVTRGRLDELLATIVDVAGGEVVLSRDQVARVVGELRDPMRPRRRLERLPELTAREWQVFELMHSELSTPEIAERLVVSPITVRSHARSIRNKLERKSALHH